MLCIRYTSPEGCDISATPSELRSVAETILRLTSASSGTHTFAGDISVSPKPYDQLLHFLTVTVTTGPVCAAVDGHMLNINGGAESLAKFASFFDFNDGSPAGHHHHYDYWEGNNYVSPNSTPLVISVAGKLHSA